MVQQRPADVTLTRHPPERGWAAPDVAPAGCCCCCLHSVGGIIGGILGSLVFLESHPQKMPEGSPFPFRRDVFEEEDLPFPTVLLYWGLVTCLSALLVLSVNLSGLPLPFALVVNGYLLILLLPAVQLAASVFLMPILLFIPHLRQARERLIAITIRSVAGAILGGLVTFIYGCALWLIHWLLF